MTALKIKQENKIIFDLSDRKYSKSQVKKLLRVSEIKNKREFNNCVIFLHNYIKIGMYTIRLWLPADSSCNWSRLKNYKDFQITIQDNKKIELQEDRRFSSQYWVKNNFFGKLRIKHLVDVIMHCQKLDNLKIFL